MRLSKISRYAAFLLALILTLSGLSATAEGISSAPAAGSQTVAQLLQILDFKFFVREDGIGKGKAPVYTAPFEDSIRLADGKASCNVADEIAVAGHDGNWLMVRYELGKKEEKNRKVRVGYIPPLYSRRYRSGSGKIEFDSIPAQLAEEIDITDNPRSNSTPFGTLPAGTDMTILAKYTYSGNWWYVETTLDGQLTRGFINRTNAAILVDGTVYHGNGELGVPVASPEGSLLSGAIKVRGKKSDAMIVRKQPDAKSSMVARAHGEDIYPCYGTESAGNGKIWYHIWADGVWGWFAGGNAIPIE